MIIYLNGTSSSGKTTLAHELQLKLKDDFFYFSIDSLLYTLPSKTLKKIQTGEKTQLDWLNIFCSYFDCLRAFNERGLNVIGDCPIYLKDQFESFEKILKSNGSINIISLTCPLEVLQERERLRGDRAIGLAQKQFENIHKFVTGDIFIDTNATTIEESVMQIVEKIL